MTTAIETLVDTLDIGAQLTVVEEIRAVIRAAPLRVPVARGGYPMRVRVSAAGKLGWTADGTGYRYASRQLDGREWPAIPQGWLDIANRVAKPHPWDSAIINWYDETASLGWHQDEDEFDLTLPIVTIMVGDACIWSIRADKASKPSSCKLGSGSVTLLAGPTRSHFHTVSKIIPEPMFSPLKKRGRVSITIRVAGDPS